MADQAENSSARILAPAALAVCAVAFFGVILISSGDDGDKDEDERKASTAKRPVTKKSPGAPTSGAAVYTVKTGDTLAGIAEQTEVSVERLQELNPELDPQGLVSGQKNKLRE
jgi:LysM repeat protein